MDDVFFSTMYYIYPQSFSLRISLFFKNGLDFFEKSHLKAHFITIVSYNLTTAMRVLSQPTPNPKALKFLCEKTMREGNKINIESVEECLMVPLASELFQLPGVISLHFFQNSITVNIDENHTWDELEGKITKIIENLGDDHDPNFKLPKEEEAPAKQYTGDLKTIDDILSRTIRPSLQMDGGDLEIVSFQDKVLTVSYEGACTSCPSAISGTLMAIQGILQDEFDPEIEVISA